MFESTFPTVSDWLTHWGPAWRVSTWWPSDSRRAMQRSLLRLLSVAHAERLELAPLVSNLAEEHRGAYRRRLRRLARRLSDGTPLVDALEQTPDVLRDESVLAIRFASQTGTLSPVYEHLVQHEDAAYDNAQASLRQTFFYALVTLLVLGSSLTFLMVFIVPILVQIREEFGSLEIGEAAPWTFELLVAACNNLSDYAPLWILMVVVIAWLVWSSSSRRFFRRFVASRWIRGVAQARSAELMQLLSFAVEAGRPIPAAISTLARYHFDKTVRHELLFARNEVEQGADVWSSLAKAGLLTPPESNALANSSSNRSRVWAMRRLAEWKENKVSRRAETIVALVQPLITLVFAAIILVVASAMIGLLSQMIETLA